MAEEARAERPNVVFILSDDHRFDFMGFVESSPAFLETPNLDRMAAQGAHFKNAFVTTSLCSPSRASILTGQYMHHHRVVDNQRPVPEGTTFFPRLLQQADYATAFVGKWHMGHDNDEPRPGFDHWVSFPGQGVYFDPTLNINGQHKDFSGYTTDVLTDQALEWLKGERPDDKPFLLYLSFKAVHYPFQPAPRHAGRYHGKPIDYPETMANTERNYQTQPRWVLDRRYSIHGIDHMETGAFDKDPVPDFDELYYNYCETVHGMDENVGRVLDYLDQNGLSEETIVVYMGDNGFHLGEHGFYDKRDAFETSIRVPMLAYAPGRIEAGTVVESMVQNVDIAPTILDVCGVETPARVEFDGRSMQPLWQGGPVEDWRDHILYEYHWEWNFPATPTVLAIRTDRYKYVYYHGTWDHDSFHDLETDPLERHNLINVPAYQDQIAELRDRLFKELGESGGLVLPVQVPAGERLDQRKRH
ncbi:sulfatase family protein [Candidatus Laterigemmans baculatus]|uniref:sulfatase family protein n=1 Tax=Candidatus Laterigemmans baculatus TaxID=2770505 RepID=UPI00193C3A45|nr:sulfatase [Candidatus Laterigemmans baculatus]